jgi:hypothetical protein
MIRWLWSKVMKWGWDFNRGLRDQDIEVGRAAIAISDDYGVDMDRAIRFAILPARGGHVFEIRHRNPQTHDRETVTHVIPVGDDVAEAVGKIVAMELLKH